MKKFLASVGNAQLLKKEGGKLVHFADVRTLTESTLSFANTMEEVRAGEGAKLYGRFAHDSGLTVTLTDAMFDIGYIAAQVGAGNVNNPSAYKQEGGLTITSGKITLAETPVNIGQSCGLNHVVVWVRKPDCTQESDWVAVTGDKINATAKTVDVSDLGFGATDTLCARYFTTVPQAQNALIAATYNPSELVLLLTTKLFAGDANAPESGKPVGAITVKIPRFQLDGTFDLSMAMSSAATMSLQGTALAVDDGTCDGTGVYAEIVEVIEGTDYRTGLKNIVLDPESLVVGSAPILYGWYKDGHTATLANTLTDITYTPTLSANGTLTTAGTLTVTVTGGAISPRTATGTVSAS